MANALPDLWHFLQMSVFGGSVRSISLFSRSFRHFTFRLVEFLPILVQRSPGVLFPSLFNCSCFGCLLLLCGGRSLFFRRSLRLFALRQLALLLCLSLCLFGVVLLLDDTDLRTLSLSLVDRLNQHALVLELVTLGAHVEVSVDVLVNLFLLAILLQQPTQHAAPADPQALARHPRVSAPTTLAHTHVASLTFGRVVLAHARAGVDLLGLPHDEPVLDELADGEAAVGHADFLGLIGVQVDAVNTALLDVRRETLLEGKRHC